MPNFVGVHEGVPVQSNQLFGDTGDIVYMKDRLDELREALLGDLDLNTISITGGAISGTAISGAAGSFTTLAASDASSLTETDIDNINISTNTISSTSGDINISPIAGSKIVLDSTIEIDAGVVTGITSLTAGDTVIDASGITLAAGDDLILSSTSDITVNTDKFTVAGDTGNTVIAGTLEVTGVITGNVTGNVTGNCSGTAATVTGAAQPAITSLGTLTNLTVSGSIIGAKKVHTITSSGTWSIPAGVTQLFFSAAGGGGAGAGGSFGAGGGASSIASVPVEITDGDTVTVTIGAGGDSSATINGGTTVISVNNTVPFSISIPGGKGAVGPSSSGGAGGSYFMAGGTGASGSGAGGASAFAPGGATETNGTKGSGGGASSVGSPGNGGDGFVTIHY